MMRTLIAAVGILQVLSFTPWLEKRQRVGPVAVLEASTRVEEQDGGTTSSRLSSTSTNTASSTCPMLQLVPSVLIMGSFFPPLTGIPLPTRSFPNQFNVHMNELYGDFYRLSVPTFGKDIQPDLYVITDPFEMQKVVQSQPPNLTTTASPKYQYPVGMLNNNGPCLDF